MHGLRAQYGTGVIDRLQAIDGILLRFNFDDPDGVSVIVFSLVYDAVRRTNAHEIGAVIEKCGRYQEDEGEDYDADHIVLNGSSLKRPH